MSSNSARPIVYISYRWLDAGRFGVRRPHDLLRPSAPLSVSAKLDRPFSSRAVSGQAARAGAWTGRRVTVFSKR